jgi:hypothetical protein
MFTKSPNLIFKIQLESMAGSVEEKGIHSSVTTDEYIF